MNIKNHKLIISQNEIHEYCTKYKEYQQLPIQDQFHIRKLIQTIVQWYNKSVEINHYAECILGGFLEAVIKNDFIRAVTNADQTNLKCLIIYAHFIYNILPMKYLDFTKEKT